MILWDWVQLEKKINNAQSLLTAYNENNDIYEFISLSTINTIYCNDNFMMYEFMLITIIDVYFGLVKTTQVLPWNT